MAEGSNLLHRPKQIASRGHFIGFLAIMAAMAVMGFLGQGAQMGSSATDPIAAYSVWIHVALYIFSIAIECAFFFYCWVGVRRYGGNLETLSGGRWCSWKELAADLGIAVSVWILCQGANWGFSRLLGPESVDSVNSLLPQKLPEIVAWIGVSISAGVCEEIAFRGYLQRQLHAMTGSVAVAVSGQALTFGVAHSYQGWKSTIVITFLGALFGALAAWRRNLRANMIVHVWVDVWEGWLKFVV
jgi:membrane protease YdiL (CAAX protease family)